MVDPPPLIRPTPGPVRSGFHYDRATPFAAGQRRGTTFATRPGRAVAAPCRGRVTFAGRTPRGGAVSIRCGRWAVTVLGVAARAGEGDTVGAGRTVGRSSESGVALSLRPATDRHGYVDPLPWIGPPSRPAAPLGPAPRAPSVPRRAPAPRSAPIPRRAPVPRPVPVPRPHVAVPRPHIASTPRPAVAPVDHAARRPGIPVPWLIAGGLGLAAAVLPALRRRRQSPRLWTDGRAPVPSRGNGLLRHDTDLLRQRRAAPRSRVLDDRR